MTISGTHCIYSVGVATTVQSYYHHEYRYEISALLLVEIIAIDHYKYGNVWIGYIFSQKGVEQFRRLVYLHS